MHSMLYFMIFVGISGWFLLCSNNQSNCFQNCVWNAAYSCAILKQSHCALQIFWHFGSQKHIAQCFGVFTRSAFLLWNARPARPRMTHLRPPPSYSPTREQRATVHIANTVHTVNCGRKSEARADTETCIFALPVTTSCIFKKGKVKFSLILYLFDMILKIESLKF